MNNIKCTLAYNGARYFGFQKTKEGPSIQETVENALKQILQEDIEIEGASRTDRGVHAEGQVIHFFSHKVFNLQKLKKSLQGILPKDISPLELEYVANSFHPTLDAASKEYHYLICNSSTQIPFFREYSWHFYLPLDIDSMQEGGKCLEGRHDFSAFTSEQYENAVRNVQKIAIISLPENRIRVEVAGENFLYKMVRTIVGTLVYVGCGKIPLGEVETILKSRDRRLAAVTAPAHGLCLKKVFY